MCYMALAYAGAGAAMQLIGNSAEDKQIGEQVAAQNATKQKMVQSMNYKIQSLNQEQQDQFEQAVTQLQTNSINSLRNQGMIEAALGETGLEGRSMEAVLREVQGQDSRVQDSIRDNYSRSWTGLQHAKEVNLMETQSSLDGMPKIQGPSAFSRTLGVIGAGVQGMTGGANFESALKSAPGLTSAIKTGFSTVTDKAKGLLSRVGANMQ